MTILTGRPLHWAITAAAGSGFLLFGYDQGVMSGLLTGLAFTAQFPEIDTNEGSHGSASLQGTVVAIYEIGCFFGSIGALVFGEKLGRRMTILIGCAILCVGGALQASAYTIPHLIVGRIVAGLGNGMNTSTIPYWVDYGMSYVDNHAQFRFPLALQCLFAVLTIVLMLLLPESPRWLIAQDRHDDAQNILLALLPNNKPDEDFVNREMAEIQHAIDEERDAAQGSSYKALLKNGPQKFFYRTMLGIGGQFMQQLSGINLITYYAPVIFQQSVGLTHNMSMLLAGFNGVAYFLSSLIPIWVIDRLGRRKLMLFAAAGQGCCMAILAGTVSDGSASAGIVASIMLFAFNFFFAIVPAEYAPLAIRQRAAALASASNWIFTFLVVEITPVSIGNIGYRTYIYFCIFNFCFLPMIYFFYPETQNLTLEQIDKLFTGDKVMLHWTPSMGEIGDVGEVKNGVVEQHLEKQVA
ncbi:hypothetical protein Daus18300_008790 [Diaporthe australafricana]|uniref:Major facilitator superfamily (MFS) profile domain-containing protein n=1 Tax=Diaporthe australafricana TaxID=127596 RepID=A0ABR3WGN7_9PEZI